MIKTASARRTSWHPHRSRLRDASPRQHVDATSTSSAHLEYLPRSWRKHPSLSRRPAPLAKQIRTPFCAS